MFGDKFNLGSLMKNAKKMQEMMQQAQEQLENLEVLGESGAGTVKITMTARHYAKNVYIDPSIFEESKEVLEDLVAAAINNAQQKIDSITKEKMLDTSKLFNIDIPEKGSKE